MKRLFPVLLLAFLTFGMPRVAEAQVTVAPFLTSNPQFLDGSGSPLNSGCVFTYAAGTTTPLVTYSDSAGSTPNSNPVLLNSGGFPQAGGIWLTAAAYKFVVKTTGGSNCSTGSTITTTDGITWATPLSTFNGITSTANVVINPGTAATSGANQSSPTLCIQGFYFNVTSLTDQWCLSDVLGTGSSPASTFTVVHSGSGGAATLSIAPNISFADNVSIGGALGAKHIDTLSDCSNSAFANTAACQTDASTTGGMFFPPNYSIGAFTNSSNRPVVDMSRVDWLGYVNVTEFGAKRDASTDDTAAIQAAINYACTGSSTTAPTANLCPNAVSGNAVGGTVYLPAGDYHTSSPLLVYGGITLKGAGKLATKITKTTNTVGSGSITAGTGVGRTPTACAGVACVDSFAVDSIISVPYISSGNTDYAYRWTIRDMALYGSGTNGTKYGIYAPRAAQSAMKDLYIFMNCSKGAPINCGSVQGSGFWTEDSWLMRHEGVTVDSSYIGWNHVNDASSLGAGTSGIFSDDWGVNIGCSGFHFFGLSYSSMIASAIDNYNKQSVDLANTDVTCAPYSFNTVAGMSINGGGAENLNGAVMYAAASSVSVSGGFKTFGQTGYTSAGTLATLFIDSSATVTMNGTSFSAVTSPGNLLNIVLQGGSMLVDTNSTLPSGGSTFIGYGAGSAKCDFNGGILTCTNSSNNSSFSAGGANLGSAPAATGLKVPVAPSALPTANGQLAYDTTANAFVGGVNGSTLKVTQTIATGTAVMTTAGIATGACGTTVTVAGTGILTTDTIDFAHNAAVTIGNGGGLTLNAWPTAGNANFNYCNSAAGTITPTAMTINWSVRRP